MSHWRPGQPAFESEFPTCRLCSLSQVTFPSVGLLAICGVSTGSTDRPPKAEVMVGDEALGHTPLK